MFPVCIMQKVLRHHSYPFPLDKIVESFTGHLQKNVQENVYVLILYLTVMSYKNVLHDDSECHIIYSFRPPWQILCDFELS